MYSEDDNIYDSSKTEYQNASIDLTDPSPNESKFESKLRKLYESVRETLQHSKTILNRNAPQLSETRNSSQVKISYDANRKETNTDLKFNGEISNEEVLNSTTVNRTQNEYIVLTNMNESSFFNKTETNGELLCSGKLRIYEVS